MPIQAFQTNTVNKKCVIIKAKKEQGMHLTLNEHDDDDDDDNGKKFHKWHGIAG